MARLNEFAAYLKEYEVDVLVSHSHWQDFPPVVQILFLKMLGVKVVLGFHAAMTHFSFRFPHTLVYPLADALVSLSRTRMTFLENFGTRSYYIPNPTNIENATNFKGRNPRNTSNTVLWVGRIEEGKRPLDLVSIMKEVGAAIPDVKLKILGAAEEPDILSALKKLIAENNLEANIEFCGYHTNVAPFYETADLLLSTSQTESWSLVIAESKFYELPLVLYELSDLELTSDGKGYISVPQGDSHGAAQAIIKILTDEELRCRLSAQARESLQSFIDYDIAGAWQKIFNDLENDSQIPAHSLENEQIQNMLLEEIFALTQQVNNLNARISNLDKH